MLDVSCRLNLLREVADGLRVYFDFILRGHLLYKQEHDQYYEICGQYIDEPDIKTEPEEEEEDEHENENENQDMSQDEATASLEEDMKSPKIPEYSHLPPDPRPDEQPEPRPDPRPDPHPDVHSTENGEENYDHTEIENDLVENDTTRHGDGEIKPKVEVESEAEAEVEMEEEIEKKVDNGTRARTSPRPDREARAALRHHNLARRLRSHKSAVSQSENEEPAPSTSTGEQRTFETMSSSVGSSGSSMSESWARARAPPPAPPAPPPRNPLSQLLDKVAKWQIIPREDTEHLPCRVYGAIHLARLFVKLPDFLNATQMPDFKLKLILKHIDMFVQYLDEHTEWFGEMYYMSDGASRSH